MKTFHKYNPKNYATSVDIRCKYILTILDQHGGRLQWRGGERVMDIGCGIGDVTRRCILPLLPRDFKGIVCADASLDMLDAAKSELFGIEHVDFLQMDIGESLDDKLKLKGTFDRIFSTFCLMYVSDQRKAFENVFELLAPGGDCFIVIMTTGAIFETGFQLSETPKWNERLSRYREVFVFPYREDPEPVKTMENLLKSVGFSNVFVKKEDFICLYPTAENFRETLKCLPDFPTNMTEEEKLDLLDDQVKLGATYNIIEEFRDESKPIKQIPFEILIIYAQKV